MLHKIWAKLRLSKILSSVSYNPAIIDGYLLSLSLLIGGTSNPIVIQGPWSQYDGVSYVS